MRSNLITGAATAVLILSTCAAFAQTAGYDGEMSRGHRLDAGPASSYGQYSATAPGGSFAAPAQRPAAQSPAPATATVVKVPSYFYKAQGVEAQ